MNPCPCGYLGDPSRECSCLPSAVDRYRGRISGPLLDRFDVRVEVPAVKYREMADTAAEEPSAAIRGRVERARALQAERLKPMGCYCNAQMGARAARTHCGLDAEAAAVMERAMDKMGLSARGYTRTLKVARTVADLEEEATIRKPHVLEALQLRLGGF
jgi:magnesium chelatase family protein